MQDFFHPPYGNAINHPPVQKKYCYGRYNYSQCHNPLTMPRYLHPDISIDMTIDIFINNAQILSDIYIHLCCRYDYSQLVYKSLTVSWHPDIAAPPWLVARHDRRAWHCCRRSRPPFRRRFWVEVAGVSQGKSVEKWWKTIGKTWENVENLENMRNKLEKDVENMEKVWNMLGDGWDIMRYNYDFLEKNSIS